MQDIPQHFVPDQDISILVVHPRNPRKGDLDTIRESIRKNGFYGTVVAQRSTNYILAGNHRVEAARAEGYTQLPVMWLDVDDDLAARILIVDNRSSDKAFYLEADLAALLREFDIGDLDGTGWSEEDLVALEATAYASPYPEDVYPDLADPPVPELPEEDQDSVPAQTLTVCPECGHGF